LMSGSGAHLRPAQRPHRPLVSSCTAWSTAISDEAQAASTVYAGPRRSRRFATREAARLGTRPIAGLGLLRPELIGERGLDPGQFLLAQSGNQLAKSANQLSGRSATR